MRDKRFLRFMLILSLSLSVPTVCCPQGFGLTKETVTLHRKLPAMFVLTGTEVSVKVMPTAPKTTNLAQGLGPLIETMLQQHDRRLTIVDKNPQTLITCNITGYVTPKLQTLTRDKTVITKQGPQTTHQQYLKATGELIVSYKAKDMKSGKTLDAAVLETKINEDYEAGGEKTKSIAETMNPKKMMATFHKKHEAEEAVPASVEDVNQMMLRNIASDVSRRVVTTDENIQVLLSKGKLEKASKLGASGLWPRMLEETESMPAFPKKGDEAYRFYNIGVAYEAMGYASPDSKQALKLFQQAAVNYGKAIDDNPEEKYFREPQTRIESALVVLKTLVDRAKAGGEPVDENTVDTAKGGDTGPAPVGAAMSTSNVAATGPSDPETLTNDSIIELAKSGMNDENLIANIRDTKHTSFDLSIKGQKELMQAGVSNAVLAAMRQKAKSGAVAHKAAHPAPNKSSAAQGVKPQ